MNTKIQILRTSQEIVDHTIQTRISVRAFLPTPIPKELILEIMEVAKRAPSSLNMQPWHVYVLTGSAKEALSEEILGIFNNPEELKKHTEEYLYYPEQVVEPYDSRKRQWGAQFYGLMGIEKGDEQKQEQHLRNFKFFDAPVGIFFVANRAMGSGSFFDSGMFVQNIMLAAQVRGLGTCPQVSFNKFHKIIAKHLNLSDDQRIICGMSMGYPDNDKIENTFKSERESAENFTYFID